MASAPPRDDQRIILHFDYDCFYASVFEAEQPILKTLPLAVQQKQIVVTCNYEARRRGLHKLQLIKEAKQICPDVIIVLGEDLTKFRNASKELYLFLRGFVWGERVEKLGFDETFMDVTDMIAYNVALLNFNDLSHSFFYLDRQDPTVGFEFDATGICGPTYPDTNLDAAQSTLEAENAVLRTRLLLGSHLAGYLRSKLEDQKGYTATAGVSTSKLLAKIVGSVHKPNSQTTLLPPYAAAEDSRSSNVLSFLNPLKIRAIPGLGSKSSRKIMSHVILQKEDMTDDQVTVEDVRSCPGMGPSLLDKILGGPGAPRHIGVKVWGLLHGVDNTQVGEARDVPTQISIENSYGQLDNFEQARKEMVTLAISLIKRMRTDLTESYNETELDNASQGVHQATKTHWIARPRTLRLSTLPRSASENSLRLNRVSHSAPLPQYVFNLEDSVDALAERLVRESTCSMFRKLHRERTGWNLRVLNLAVTNMMEVAGNGKHNSGRDIGKMFRRQEPEPCSPPGEKAGTELTSTLSVAPEASWESDGEEESMSCVPCSICGVLIPHFALVAHELYHQSDN
ncbi:hypothetical protein BJY04DRAFT_207214 [Aspergillus karnatakaensis]|uniref:putative DNA polymerase iota n=1 Tax=Aspergillus karnatakaensis TaxID=1810916 RepID=UPI003CCDCAA1